ncbi:hypothetical protein EV121DRAFT_297278 [Schizophyllum commune]
MACHAIDSFVKEGSADEDAAFDLLVAHFTGLLFTTLGYESIKSALQKIGHSEVSALFKSAFLVRPGLPLAKFLKPGERLPATLAISLFWYLVKLAKAALRQDRKFPVLRVLNHHVTDYCEVLAEALDYDEISVDLLLDLASVVLDDPQLGTLAIPDALAASLATQLIKVTALDNLRGDSMHRCLYLNALCAARANSTLVGKMFPDASRKLHSALLSLSTYQDAWKSELTWQLKRDWIPLAVALALKDSHGCAALAEWVDDLPALMQDPKSGLEVRVPPEVREGEDLDWYRLFTSDPDKYFQASDRCRNWKLHISELVSFEEAVERMQRTDAERAARETQRVSQGDGAEVDANNDAEGPGRELDQVEDQGDATRTENETTDRLRTLGAWVVAPLQRVRPFLARIPGLRQLGGRGRPSSIALSTRDVDVERDAGFSAAPDPERRGGNPPTPARESEGVQDDSAGPAMTERSGGDPPIPALASKGGRDGVRAQDGAQAQEDAQARDDDEQSHDDKRARDGEQDQDSSQDQEDAHAEDDERSQAGEEPHVQRGQTPDEAVGTGARDDAEHGGTSARGTSDAGQGGVQGHGGEHDETGEPARGDQHGWSDAQDRDGEQAKAGAQDRNSAQSQAHEVPLAQTQETEVELRARDDTADEGEH